MSVANQENEKAFINGSNFLIHLVGYSLNRETPINMPFIPQIGSYFVYKNKSYKVDNIVINNDIYKIELGLSSLI